MVLEPSGTLEQSKLLALTDTLNVSRLLRYTKKIAETEFKLIALYNANEDEKSRGTKLRLSTAS